jgi:ribonuclease HI
MNIIAYTDGSCNAKTQIGGCGVYARVAGKKHEIRYSEGYANTKTGRMELMAVIKLLELIDEKMRRDVTLTIHSDSQYIVKSINIWLKGWMRYDPKLERRTNGDLWMRYHELSKDYRDIRISWVKGHSGVYGNEVADELAHGAYIEHKHLANMLQIDKLNFDLPQEDWGKPKIT